MSKIAYFDCAFGAAGDMLVGACIDCGVSPEHIEAELRKLDLPAESFSLGVAKVHRASIFASKFDVALSDHSSEHSHDHDHNHSHNHSQDHGHSHSDGHVHDHDHDHSHAHDAAHGHEHDVFKPERALSQILALIQKSALAPSVKKLASDIFNRLGRAEASVHGVSLDDIHFHEVGAVDAICDIVGFAIAYVSLGIEQAVVSPMPIGSGTVRTMHGRYPVPGPAVLALLSEAAAPTSAFPLPYECLTPTGAAILCEIANHFGTAPAFARIEKVGYGAGTLNPGDHPNVVRLIFGEGTPQTAGALTQNLTQAGSYDAEIVAVIEANIDDLAPPVMAYAMERLLEAGALDVALTPLLMKKNRMAQKLSVICRPDDRKQLTDLILAETSTIGTRSYFCERLTLNRDFQVVTIGAGPSIRVKLARDAAGQLLNVQPEYEDCVSHARETGKPLKDVILASLAKAAEMDKSVTPA